MPAYAKVAESESSDEESEERSCQRICDQVTGLDAWRKIWFVTALLSLANAIVGMAVIEFKQIVNFVQMFYLAFFSLILLIQSAPWKTSREYQERWQQPNCIDSMRDDIEKYLHFLYRYTFKGMFFIYIGTSSVSFYFIVEQNPAIKWGGSAVGLFIVFIGVVTMISGIQFTCKLSGLQRKARRNFRDNPNIFSSYVQMNPETSALDPREFHGYILNMMDVSLSGHEMMHMFKAFHPEEPNLLPVHILEDWAQGKMGMGMGVM